MQTILKTLYVYILIKPNLCCSSGSWWSWNSAVGMERRERLSWAILFLPVVADMEKNTSLITHTHYCMCSHNKSLKCMYRRNKSVKVSPGLNCTWNTSHLGPPLPRWSLSSSHLYHLQECWKSGRLWRTESYTPPWSECRSQLQRCLLQGQCHHWKFRSQALALSLFWQENVNSIE